MALLKKSDQNSYNPTRDRHSVYVLPYYDVDPKNVKVLIAVKNAYDKKNGYIHTNCGQRAMVGGSKNHNETKKQGAFREFHEETGTKIKPNDKNIEVYEGKNGKFTTFFYKVTSKKDYHALTELRPTEEEELESLEWVDLGKAREIFKSDKNNPPLGGDKGMENMICDYVEAWWNEWNRYWANDTTKKWTTYHKLFANFASNKNNFQPRRVDYKVSANDVFADLGDSGIYSRFQKNVQYFLRKHIWKRTKSEWFGEIIEGFVTVVCKK